VRIVKIGFVLALAMLLGACASTLSAEQRASIKRVSIGKVQMPEKAIVLGDHAGTAFLVGGAIGSAIEQGTSSLPAEFEKALVKSRTDVAAVFRADLERKLASKGFEIVPEGDPRADATIVPRVTQYGLTGVIFRTPPTRFPNLGVRVELRKAGDNDLIWSNHAAVNISEKIFRQLDARPILHYLEDPVLLNTQFRKASDLVTEEVLTRL
jgi:hypothetical protein